MLTNWQPSTCLPCAAARTSAAQAAPTGSDSAGLALAGSIAAGLPWPLVLLLALVYLGNQRKGGSP